MTDLSLESIGISIIMVHSNYLDKRKLAAYWANTSSKQSGWEIDPGGSLT